MSQEYPNNQLKQFVAELNNEKQPMISVARLKKNLVQKVREMRELYRQASGRGSRNTVEEWLRDNYYILEKECKQSVKDLRGMGRRAHRDELSRIYHLFSTILTRRMPSIDSRTLSILLGEADRWDHLTEFQFAFAPTAIKIVLIEMAYMACTGKMEEPVEAIGYAIVGLNKLYQADFPAIVHECSEVERILWKDPAGIYGKMVEESRQHYRYLISLVAKKTGEQENQVARKLLRKARSGPSQAQRHVGHYLLAHPDLVRHRQSRGVSALVLGAFLPLVCSVILGLLCKNAWVSVLSVLPFWEILRILIQQLALYRVDMDYIPRMDLEKLEDRPKTAVLVSTLLPKASEAEGLRGRLEQLYFSNSDEHMYYCILADFKEWNYPSDAKDDSQIAACKKVIDSLNKQYNNRFMLFLRKRAYNKTQGRYSGWERKRGAITEFIRYIHGRKTTVHTFVGDKNAVHQLRYLIALDSDTNLNFESAQTLVAAALHPQNKPVIDQEKKIVTSGYGILVPRMSADLASAGATAFSRIMAGCGGVTAYDTRNKDFYQDLFSSSIFAGKGLIDVECFYQLLDRRFPDNQVLSHDILEGSYLRTGFLSDVEMTDGVPPNMMSWLSRLHRWIRGDWQNIRFLGNSYRLEGKKRANPIPFICKYQLLDNLRRSFTPVTALACVIAALFTNTRTSLTLLITGLLAVSFAQIWSAILSLAGGNLFNLARRFFTGTIPNTFELLGQALFSVIMLIAQALISLDAIVRSLWRTYVSRKRMLEWTTAAQGEASASSFWHIIRRYWAYELFGILYFLFAPYGFLQLAGLIFAMLVPVAVFSSQPTRRKERRLDSRQRDILLSYNAAMWRYYEEFANEKNNYLPPDNIQQSPAYRVAARTSPTNIGLMMLSCLAARDFDFIDDRQLYERIDRTLSTVESMKKWEGNLYNWYDTETLELLRPAFVSTVDSGNFVCCLVALKEGLREYSGRLASFNGLVERMEAIIDQTDLRPFYNKRNNLFVIGYDAETGEMTHTHYDFFMSEARMTSYFAVAKKMVSKKHWGALNRTMCRNGSYAGPVSWTGTMFEYFMPHLLLPVYEGSLLSEALAYCLYCQKRRVKQQDIPWGISESAYYGFDNNLNYQYKAHGVQKTGVKQNLDRELVISPYSTFLTIAFNPNSAMENLDRLNKLGVYGMYGFFEAVDFTQERVGDGTLAVIRNYMAHHIGMSMVASCNSILCGRMQNRFMRDPFMKSAKEFLQEKIAKDAVIYDEVKMRDDENRKPQRDMMGDTITASNPRQPGCLLLSNGEMTDVLTDVGAGYLRFGDVDLTRRSTDLLRRPQGIFTLIKEGDTLIPLTKAPYYREGIHYTIRHQSRAVTFYAQKDTVHAGMRCVIHPTLSAQQRQLLIKNGDAKKKVFDLLFYLEPVLSNFADYNAHPAFSKLFVTARHDADSNVLVFTRRSRKGDEQMALVLGFLEDLDFEFELKRETLMPAPRGLDGLLDFERKEFSNSPYCAPDACCAIRFRMSVPAGAQKQLTLLISAARNEEEGISNIVSIRAMGEINPKQGAKSPVLEDTLESRLGYNILGKLLFPQFDCEEILQAVQENKLGQSGLWAFGISGDIPLVLMQAREERDRERLQTYLKLQQSLRKLNIEFDLCLLPEEGANYELLRGEAEELCSQLSICNMIGCRGGLFVIDPRKYDPAGITLLKAAASHIVPLEMSRFQRDVKEDYRPVKILPAEAMPMPSDADLSVYGGGFFDDRFIVSKSSPLPWCHILSNPQFGVLVSDKALGYTWAVNSRENKLTPWYNDITTDNAGELLLIKLEGRYYNLIDGARASFSKKEAVYEGRVDSIYSKVSVTVSGEGCVKYCEVVLENMSDHIVSAQAAYYIEPVLGVGRETARFIRVGWDGDALLFSNPYNTAVICHGAMAAEGCDQRIYLTDRYAFLTGRWEEGREITGVDPCGALVCPVDLQPGERILLRYSLAYGETQEEAKNQAVRKPSGSGEFLDSIMITTPEKALDSFINHFAAHQILACRLWARCAFYQCGGAYGFRDQLQDTTAILLLNGEIAKDHILRCCAVQFEEGDVLHWWHPLPENAGGLKGVRTRFSDDLVWLPYAVCEYLEKTGDKTILEQPVSYICAPELEESVQEQYISPGKSGLAEPVYRHCLKALDRAYQLGERRLPLIGCGDWCDGFSNVGVSGKGMSVWLALFLALVSERFAAVCDLENEPDKGEELRERARILKAAVDESGWDGRWYCRAFYDNGQIMGGDGSEECAIDLLPQSFAVFAEMQDAERVGQGLDNALSRLVDEKLQLVKLFDPPFGRGEQKPGYVKAYPPGIRENGGQYTHSAVWFAMALIKGGRRQEGWKILRLLNPVQRCMQRELAAAYKLEPYYMAADIYTNDGVPGRGGWSIYTGAASWYYRAVLECLLGLRLEGEKIRFSPRLPEDWKEAKIDAIIRGTRISVLLKGKGTVLTVDNEPADAIPLDGKEHHAVWG